jgi:sulfate transporter 4
VKFILGVSVPRTTVIHEQLIDLFQALDGFTWQTFVMGMICLLVLLGFKSVGNKYPNFKWIKATGPFFLCIFTIALTFIFNLEDKGIVIVGMIPEGLPSLSINQWTPMHSFDKMIVVVVIIFLVDFIDTFSIAKQLASKSKQELNSTQEMFGLGFAHLFGSAFHAYPVTGSFSRSAVNYESGATSAMSGIIQAALVGFTLLFLTPIFEKLPFCVIAAIVISCVIGLLDYAEAIQLWHVHKLDFLVWMVSFLGVIFLGVEIGLGIAVALSLLIVLYEAAVPYTSVLGRLPGTSMYRNVKQYPDAEQYPGLLMVRVDAPLFFANVQYVRDKIMKFQQSSIVSPVDLENQKELSNKSKANIKRNGVEGSIKYVILDMSAVSNIDASAIRALREMMDLIRNDSTNIVNQQDMIFVNPSIPVMRMLHISGLLDIIGHDHVFTGMHDAVCWCLQILDETTESVALLPSSSSNDLEAK